ncbi:hypothetical protein EDD22DRAFT_347573 [Suillus occidentalis]|nr:hypothetical protein EDD22DRAFT_347573 [Suillus occidentalis]
MMLMSNVLPLQGAAGKFLMDTDATRRPTRPNAAHVLPRGFFDDTYDGIHSSTTRGVHTYSSGHRTVSLFSWSPRALLGRLSSQFRSSNYDAEATELHRQKRTTFSRRSPPVVEVATVQDKKALFVARRPEQDKAQQRKPHRPAQASTSQTQPTTSSTSTTHPVR